MNDDLYKTFRSWLTAPQTAALGKILSTPMYQPNRLYAPTVLYFSDLAYGLPAARQTGKTYGLTEHAVKMARRYDLPETDAQRFDAACRPNSLAVSAAKLSVYFRKTLYSVQSL